MVHLKTLTGLQRVPGPPNHSEQGRQRPVLSNLGPASDRHSTALWVHHGREPPSTCSPCLYFVPEMGGIKLSTSLLLRQDLVTISY